MIITVTVNKCCAPQTVFPTDGPRVLLGPGESLTADFSDEQEEYIRASPGHYTVEVPSAPKPVVTQAANPIDLSSAAPAASAPKPAPKPQQHRARRGRGKR